MQIKNFHIKIKEGKIYFKSEHHKELFDKYIAQFKDGQYRLTVESVKEKRSEQQHKYYWLYLGVISDLTGYTRDEIHEWAKGKFLTRDIKEMFGSKVRIKTSTTKLTKSEFTEYLMNISQATEIMLPDTTEFYGYSYHK